MEDKLRDFIGDLATIEPLPNVHNQYDYSNEENAIRRENLFIYLKQMQILKPRIMLVAEAPGYRGSRLTGVPFTSEHLLMNNMNGTHIFGKEAGFRLAASSNDKLLKEATATIIRETLVKHEILALAWNAFPYHPYKPGIENSNRTPLKNELIIGEQFLLKLIELYEIEHIVAVGRKAEQSLKKLNIPAHVVRHPAQGGKNEFVQGIIRIKRNLLNTKNC